MFKPLGLKTLGFPLKASQIKQIIFKIRDWIDTLVAIQKDSTPSFVFGFIKVSKEVLGVQKN